MASDLGPSDGKGGIAVVEMGTLAAVVWAKSEVQGQRLRHAGRKLSEQDPKSSGSRAGGSAAGTTKLTESPQAQGPDQRGARAPSSQIM